MNESRLLFGRSLRIGSVVALGGLLMLGTVSAAQEAEAPHPAHIHSGTCETLGDVVAPLTDVAPLEGEASGPASAVPVKVSETTIDMPLQEIIDGGHAINVHQSAEEIDVYIACGDIGGVVHQGESDSETELMIGLGELNGSGHVGTAWLGARGDQTFVQVTLIEPSASAPAAESAQEAAPATAAADGIAVEIKDFAFNPVEISVPAGGSITWTNGDDVPHTATAIDREALQSGPIAAAQSFSQAFDTAGNYEYFCEFHPNMKGTIVVE